MYKRLQCSDLIERMREPRHFIQVVVGPRQIGKTTMVRQAVEEVGIPYLIETADAVATDSVTWIADTWASARARMRVGDYKEYLLVIDEIHKIDNWSEYVKREWDNDTANGVNLKVVLLGSSRLLLKSGLNESLAGRFEMIRMMHWDYEEMRDAFDWTLEQYIYYGGYPGAAHLIGNERRWRRYMLDAIVAPSIEKDVLLTKVVYKPALMQQVFDLGCAYSGEELSLNKMMGQLTDAGNITTISSYLTTLGEASLLCGMSKYANDSARKYNSVPKLMAYNTALLTIQSGRGYEKERIDPARWGRWVETAVGAHLLCHADEGGYRVYYWRERDNEVDFVIQRQHKLVAIEVKGGKSVKNNGLGIFKQKYSPQMSFIVGRGGMPVEEFLLTPPERILDAI